MKIIERNGVPEIFRGGPIVGPDGTTHPSNIVDLPQSWSAADLKALGIFELIVDRSAAAPLKREKGSLETWPKVKADDRYTITAEYEPLPLAEVREMVREKILRLFRAEETERSENQYAQYRDRIRARYVLLRDAYQAGKTVDIEIGSIDGAGAWPT